MGAWGYDIYENDIAMDCIDEYELYIERGYSVRLAIDELKGSSYMDDRDSVLVIADLEFEKFKKIKDDTKEIVITKIKDDILNINEWREPQERLNVLDDFISKTKLKIKLK